MRKVIGAHDGRTVASLAEFFRRCCMDGAWKGCDVGGYDVQNWGVDLGLLVVTPYDPAVHHDPHIGGLEPGEPWYEFTPEVIALIDRAEGADHP